MKILITGGTGFIGYNIAKKLSHNNKIYLIKRNISKKKNPKNVKIITYSDNDELNKKLKKISVNVVIHAATHYSKIHNFKDLEQFSNSNILFGNIILENLKKMKVKKFINFSTVWEDYNAIKENSYNLYSAYKNAFSKILKFYMKINPHIKHYDLMISDTFGQNDNRLKIVNTLRKNYKKNLETKIISKNLILNLLNVEDIVRAVSTILDQNIKPGKYLLKNNKNLNIFKLIEIFNKTYLKKIKVFWKSKKRINQKIYSYNKLSGWKPVKSNISDIIKIIKN